MKYIHCYWFKPFLDLYGTRFNGGFPAARFFWYSWALSYFCIAKKSTHFELVTDSYGAEIVRSLGLEYSSVLTPLDELRAESARFWNYAKFYTYLSQSEPFLQIDTDAFLWKGIPSELGAAPLVAQSYEELKDHTLFYGEMVRALVGRVPKLTKIFSSFAPPYPNIRALNCGIFGGNRLDLIHDYARECIACIDAPENVDAWEEIAARGVGRVNLGNCGIAIEQLSILHWIEEYSVTPGVLVKNPEFGEQAMMEAGLTHLIGVAKMAPHHMTLIEARLRRDLPALKERIDRLFPD